ncbi:MAG: hypothetical protein HY909_09025 [Deltaproteobacteria bacterium]|nr:hypothetical protein [Deltaproteobacteria bacterium]
MDLPKLPPPPPPRAQPEALALLNPATLVPGAVALAALAYLGLLESAVAIDLSWPWILVLVLPSLHALGLLCTALGRPIRRAVNPWQRLQRAQWLVLAFRAHGLLGDPRFRGYFTHPSGLADPDALEPRLWTEVRSLPAHLISYEVARARADRASMFDGLLPALILWVPVLVLALITARGVGAEFFVGIPLLFATVACVAVSARAAGVADRAALGELLAAAAATSTVPWGAPYPGVHAQVQMPAQPMPQHHAQALPSPPPPPPPVHVRERDPVAWAPTPGPFPTSPRISLPPPAPPPAVVPPPVMSSEVFRPSTLIAGSGFEAPTVTAPQASSTPEAPPPAPPAAPPPAPEAATPEPAAPRAEPEPPKAE